MITEKQPHHICSIIFEVELDPFELNLFLIIFVVKGCTAVLKAGFVCIFLEKIVQTITTHLPKMLKKCHKISASNTLTHLFFYSKILPKIISIISPLLHILMVSIWTCWLRLFKEGLVDASIKLCCHHHYHHIFRLLARQALTLLPFHHHHYQVHAKEAMNVSGG